MTDSNQTEKSTTREALVVETLVQLADTLIQDYDVIEFLGLLSERCVSLVDADEAGIMVTDGTGSLQVVASSSERSRLLELLELQNRDGPCLDAFTSGQPVASADLDAERDTFGFRSVHSTPVSASRAASAQLQTALTSRVRLEQAKGMIADRHSIEIDTAFEQMRAYARSHHRQISDVALSIVRDNFDIGD